MYHKFWWNNNRWCWGFRFSHANVQSNRIYSWNYSKTTRSLWFYSKHEVSNFHNNIADIDNFKSFKYKAKLLENTVAQSAANGIFRNAAIAVPLKYLSYFWRLIETLFINYKIELKLRWTKYCVLSVAGNKNNINVNAKANNFILTIKDKIKYYCSNFISKR